MEPEGNVTVETKQLSDGRTIATSKMSFEELTQGKEFEVANGTKVVLTFTVTANGYAGEDVNNTADYKFNPETLSNLDLTDFDLIHIGSLFLSKDESLLINGQKRHGQVVSGDQPLQRKGNRKHHRRRSFLRLDS